jgi:conjugal transfer mating pair stabilization protein TraN
MKIIAMFIFIIVINTSAFAGSCIKKSEVCTDNSTRTIGGTAVTRCWNYRSIYSCPSENFTDYCAAISSVQGCVQTNSVCTKTNSNGGCDTYENTYSCGSKLGNIDNIIYLTSNYTITTDSLDKSACTEPENNKNCTLTAQTCTQGPETRNINGLDVYKDCWKYDYKYSCLGNVQYDNCDGLNSNCTYLSKNCIAPGSQGNCLTAERSYQCNKESTGPTSMVCQGQIYCINGDCQQAKTIPDTGLVKGLTYMSLIKKAGDEFNADGLSIFAGAGKSCHKDIAGFNNCCADDGWGQDIGLASCSTDEKTLATQSSNGQCHLVGTYCSNKSVFGICLEKRKSYCCFPSKLGRIIQEQGRPQVNKGWGSPQAPACEGLTIEQLQSLDFTKIDLTEIFPDVGKAISVPDGKQVIDTMKDRVKGHYAK